MAGSTWTDNGGFWVGCSGSGTMKITRGGSVSNTVGYIGYISGSTGTVTVDGSGSTWTSSSDLYVGYDGDGTLNIANGGGVAAIGTTYVGSGAGSSGTVNFGANGGTLTTGSLAASPNQLTGTGTVNACGLVSDLNLAFDSTHGLKQTITLNSLPGQNVVINLDMSNTANNGALGAGWQGAGSLTVQDGIAVTSSVGYPRLLARLGGLSNGLRRRLDLDQRQRRSTSATTAAERSTSPAAAASATPTATSATIAARREPPPSMASIRPGPTAARSMSVTTAAER